MKLTGIKVTGVTVKDGKISKRKSFANVSQKIAAQKSKKVRVKRKV